MITILAGLSAAVLLWWVLKTLGRMNPARIAAFARQVGGGLALLVAALLLFRGRIDMALLLGSGGAWLLGWNVLPSLFGRGGFGGGGGRRRGGRSEVRSATIEMQLDHDSGRMSGRVLRGPFGGRSLDDLGRPELLSLRRDCVVGDPDAARLLEAYLDGRHPGWREDAEAGRDAGSRADPQGGAMSEKEAHEVLGLEPGADPAAIRRAHRTLMKKLHPDGGGSTYLASRVNEAKDVLLNRHR